jgi:hypothetical protein
MPALAAKSSPDFQISASAISRQTDAPLNLTALLEQLVSFRDELVEGFDMEFMVPADAGA